VLTSGGSAGLPSVVSSLKTNAILSVNTDASTPGLVRRNPHLGHVVRDERTGPTPAMAHLRASTSLCGHTLFLRGRATALRALAGERHRRPQFPLLASHNFETSRLILPRTAATTDPNTTERATTESSAIGSQVNIPSPPSGSERLGARI
jgi:hypothetical protein